jgi:hypothetical protein
LRSASCNAPPGPSDEGRKRDRLGGIEEAVIEIVGDCGGTVERAPAEWPRMRPISMPSPTSTNWRTPAVEVDRSPKARRSAVPRSEGLSRKNSHAVSSASRVVAPAPASRPQPGSSRQRRRTRVPPRCRCRRSHRAATRLLPQHEERQRGDEAGAERQAKGRANARRRELPVLNDEGAHTGLRPSRSGGLQLRGHTFQASPTPRHQARWKWTRIRQLSLGTTLATAPSPSYTTRCTVPQGSCERDLPRPSAFMRTRRP